MSMIALEQHFTLEDLKAIEARPENQSKLFELIEGEIREKMGTSFLPSAIALKIASAILIYLDKNPIGYVTGADGSYIMSVDTKLIPDVGYISKSRMPEIPSREVPIPPDLAVEVVSPTDDLRDVQKKAVLYLQYGVQQVWVVYPEDQTVDVYRPAENGAYIQTLSIDGVLDGGELLPQFSLKIQTIFAV